MFRNQQQFLVEPAWVTEKRCRKFLDIYKSDEMISEIVSVAYLLQAVCDVVLWLLDAKRPGQSLIAIGGGHDRNDRAVARSGYNKPGFFNIVVAI